MKRILSLFIITIGICFKALAGVEVRSSRLTVSDGLANNSVRCIYQDRKGFIWFGTLDGLNRYDGSSFLTFLPERGKGISLSDHRMYRLKEDKNGFLWIRHTPSVFSCYDLKKGQVVDFTGYSASARLAASERHMDNAHFAGDEYEAVFIYEKDGKTREFSLDDLPDSTWTYVSTETVRKETGGWDESIVTLPVMDASGESYDYLAVSPKVMVVSVYDADGLSPRKWRALAGFLRSSADSGFRPLLLAAVSPEKGEGILSSLEQEEGADTGFLREVFYYSDYKTLVSLNRSNGGATYFADGFLVKKWSFRGLPGENRIAELGQEDPTEPLLSYGTAGNLLFQAFLLYSFAVMLLL